MYVLGAIVDCLILARWRASRIAKRSPNCSHFDSGAWPSHVWPRAQYSKLFSCCCVCEWTTMKVQKSLVRRCCVSKISIGVIIHSFLAFFPFRSEATCCQAAAQGKHRTAVVNDPRKLSRDLATCSFISDSQRSTSSLQHLTPPSQ